MKYIVPEYYKHFKCKCGNCRHSCCEGWPVRISMKEYYRLLGVECSERLRAKLDCALKICPEPGKECYAQISADWRGTCMMHREDGLCALQAELGENALPEVCRLYPRNTRQLAKSCECSCSNSCEEVLELLMNLKGPLQFEEKALSFVPEFELNIPSDKYEYCKKSLSIIQNRSLSLAERFFLLGNFLYDKDIVSKKPENLSYAFLVLHDFDEYFKYSSSICDYCRTSQCYFGIEGKENLSAKDLDTVSEKYKSASEHLEKVLPDWQILFEQLIVNHMFYNDFPCTDHPDKIKDAFLSLIVMYSFLRFNILGFMSDRNNPDNLVDFLAAMFRLIEHSNFRYTAVNLFMEEKYSVRECIPELIYV